MVSLQRLMQDLAPVADVQRILRNNMSPAPGLTGQAGSTGSRKVSGPFTCGVARDYSQTGGMVKNG